jgi:hypothetical protein
MMGHREKQKSADEWDAFTGWRRLVSWGKKRIRKIKKGFTRRVRRSSKQKLRKE